MLKLKPTQEERYKRRAYKFVNKNSKFQKIANTIDYSEIGNKCFNDLREYEKTKNQNLQEYENLKLNSEEFLKTYFELKKKKMQENKKMIELNPFFELVSHYVQKGYKRYDLTSTNKNIFRRSLLIEDSSKFNEYFEIYHLSQKEEKELNFLKRFKKNVNNLQEERDFIKKLGEKQKKKNINSESDEDINISELLKNKNHTIENPEEKLKEEKELKKKEQKERENLLTYNECVKGLIESVEKEHQKTKLNLNKKGLIFPSSTTAKRQIKIKYGLSPVKTIDSPKGNNDNNNSFFHPFLKSSKNVKKNIKKNSHKNSPQKFNKTFGIIFKKAKNKRANLPVLSGFNNSNMTLSTNINEQTINSISMSLGESNGDINDFLKVIGKTKRRIIDYDADNIRRIILSKGTTDNKSVKFISQLQGLDKQILHLDKDLIKAFQQSKTDF